MRRYLLLAATLAAIAIAMGMGSMGVAAQDQANESAAPVAEFDDATQITDAWYSGGSYYVEIDTRLSREFTVFDRLQGVSDEGAVTMETHTHDLERGTHTVSIPVETIDGGAAIGVATETGTVFLSTGVSSGDPIETFTPHTGLFWGMGLSVLMSGGAAVYVVKTEDSGVVKA